jgi:hypothetical protein
MTTGSISSPKGIFPSSGSIGSDASAITMFKHIIGRQAWVKHFNGRAIDWLVLVGVEKNFSTVRTVTIDELVCECFLLAIYISMTPHRSAAYFAALHALPSIPTFLQTPSISVTDLLFCHARL